MSDHYVVEFAPEYQGMLERIATALEVANKRELEADHLERIAVALEELNEHIEEKVRKFTCLAELLQPGVKWQKAWIKDDNK